MPRFSTLTALLILVAGTFAAESYAQGRSGTAGRPSVTEARGADWWQPRPYAREGYAPRRAVRRDAPPFCQDRTGHPVHGWRWCVEKGFVRPEARHAWRPYRPSRVVVVRKRPRRVVSPRVVIGADVILDVLGAEVYANVEMWGRRSGYRGEPVGRWMPHHSRGWVLQVRQDGFPLAELIDENGDRRIDQVWVYEPETLQKDDRRDKDKGYNNRHFDDQRFDDRRY